MDFTVEQLAIEHDYYCSSTNYYSNEAGGIFETFVEFWENWNCENWSDDDSDSNLMFRWDIGKKEEVGFNGDGYVLQMYFLKQRKGIFCPIIVKNFEQKDVANFLLFAEKHINKLKQIWQPLTKLFETID